MYGVFAACIVWFAFAMVDPNYKWVFVDDNVMRVRNALLILLALFWILATVRFHRMALGYLPVARLERTGAKIDLIKTPPMPFGRVRRATLESPVVVSLTEERSVSFGRNTFLRSVKFRHRGGQVRVNTVWAWDGVDQVSLERYLGQVN